MLDEPSLPARPAISRRTVIGAAAWSVPVVALTVATPAHAASGGALDATGVVLTFTGPQWSSEFTLSGQLVLSPAAPAPTDVTATITWQGTGDNAGAQGMYVYGGGTPPIDAGVTGWTYLQGAPDNQLHPTVVLGNSAAAGTTSIPTVSIYDGDTSKPIMYGAETPNGGSAFWDGIITIRFSAAGYADAVLTVPYTQTVE
ncbi:MULTISPECIES: hypothetical protein [unclassified Microbacterium]|uniref:hypothetical protein n=1 Tax=unclassified Microbacterium TaxID=2609290 RepID=UPI00109CA0C1|nr:MULTISPECIES: hypothetical protein [unclassified Microbacterium]